METLRIIGPVALGMALVGLLESLMTAKLVDDGPEAEPGQRHLGDHHEAPSEPAPEPAAVELQEIHEPEALPFTQAERAPAASPLLVGLALTRADLVSELGIGEALADAALAAVDEDALLALLSQAVEWQGLALLELASGHSVAQVKETFSLATTEAEPEASEEERLIKGLQHPAAQISFAWIENNEELRRVVVTTFTVSLADQMRTDLSRLALPPRVSRDAPRTPLGRRRLTTPAHRCRTRCARIRSSGPSMRRSSSRT